MSPLRTESATGGDALSPSDSPPSSKKSTTRRNAWGNLSYADLITQAILNSPDKRLTLSQGILLKKNVIFTIFLQRNIKSVYSFYKSFKF